MKFKSFSVIQLIFVLLTILCMVLIFHFSSETAEESTNTSDGFTAIAISIFYPDFDDRPLAQQEKITDTVTFAVRKCAHFTIYAALGFCCAMAMGRRKLISRKNFAAQGISSLYACTDEIHQIFSDGRAGRFTDVLIDSAGAFTGILFAALAVHIVSRFTRKKLP